MAETILVINAGSSSIKFQLFAVEPQDHLERRFKGQIEGVGARPHLIAVDPKCVSLADETWPAAEVSDLPSALDKVIAFLRPQIGGALPTAVGHRVVHGGPDFTGPVVVDAQVVANLEQFVPMAPLHQPNNLAPIRAVLERRPHLFQVACFDTAFHRNHPELADRFAIPEHFYSEGVRKYGFHGLSYEFIAHRLGEIAPDIAKGRVVVAHLGNGASMCAIVNGRSVESTMGFTALDGLPMGTRSGQIDPGVVLYFLTEKGMAPKTVEDLLYRDCGLKGLSGISSDVRELLASPDPRAQLALDYFAYRIALATGTLAAAMGGIDGFVFTAGIGENAQTVREAVLRRIAWLGFDISVNANKKNSLCITRKGSRVPCFIIPTNEERMIASHTLRLMRARNAHALEEKRA